MHRDTFFFTAIVIEKSEEAGSSPGDYYNIQYAKNFNPNLITYITFAYRVKKEMIPGILIELSKMYFKQLNPEKDQTTEERPETKDEEGAISFQCSNCLTVYDQTYGDPAGNIPKGTAFENLPDNYKCHVCDGPKKEFVPRNAVTTTN